MVSREETCPRHFLSIGILAMFHCGNIHEEIVVVNFVKDTIRPLANSVSTSVKLLDSRRPGVQSKLVDSIPYCVPQLHGNRLKALQRFPLDVDLVHGLDPS